MISVSNGFMMYSFAPAPTASWMCLMSFSVVQKTTTGTAPPLIRRRARRNSMPFITGIFQSSSMASGICRKQAAMASWPSAASSMANSSSSRIRRATLRTTRESSTMRQDFMTSLSAIQVIGHGGSGRFRAGRDIKQARDVEHHQQRAFEPVDAGRDFTPARIEGRRIALEIRRREAEDLADGIDHQAVELPAMIDDHAHARLAGDLFRRALGQAETGADVDRGDDPAAQVERAGNLARRPACRGADRRWNYRGSCGTSMLAERLGKRGEQRIAVEFGDVVAEADLATAVEILRRGMRRQGDERRVLPAGRAAHRFGELEAVHPRHLDIAHDDVEILARLAQAEGTIRRLDGGDLVAGDRQERRQQVAEERRIVDDQDALGVLLGVELAMRAEPIVEGEREEIAGIDDVRRLSGDDRTPDIAAPLDRELLLDDVENLVDDEAHRVLAIGEDEDGLAARLADGAAGIDGDERHQLAAVLHDRLLVRVLDTLELDLLEPGDEGQRHCLRPFAAGAEQQEAGTLAAAAGTRHRLLANAALLDGDVAARRRDAVGIENHDDAAVAQDGIAGEHGDVAQDRRDRLDDDFLGVEDAIDDDAEAVGADLSDDDEGLAALFARRAELEQALQRDERQQPVAQAQHRRVVHLLDAVLRIRRGAHQLDDADLRDGEFLAGALDDERRDDGEGERDLDDEGRAFAFLALQLDGAADLLDIGAHHIHADAAAGDAGHLARRREPGLEDELLDLLVGHAGEIGVAREAARHCLLLDLVQRQAAPVIADLEHDVP